MTSTRGGRPKTSAGHRDDAALGLFDALTGLRTLRQMRAEHYRAERSLIHDIEKNLVGSGRAWRLAELIEMAGVDA